MPSVDAVIEWLLAGDPAIRWQTMRDLLAAPEHEWRAERAKVETEGWGARLLAQQDADGQWAAGSFVPGGFTPADWRREGQPWTSTCWALGQLREFGLDPASARMRETVSQLRESSQWDHAGQPFWDGEVEECINGRLLADGAYFGVDMAPVLERLLAGRQGDGGWNCDRERGSRVSSFASTINVLEGLLEYLRASGDSDAVSAARATGEEYLLQRGLYRRRSTGEPADPEFLSFWHPSRAQYDVLRALDYFRAASGGAPPDKRLDPAVQIVRAQRGRDGRWALGGRLAGRVWFELEGPPGTPSRWVTLRALRVLRWYAG